MAADGILMELPVFWARNKIGKTSYYYLKRLGRGPKTISIGTKELVSPESESDWRAEMASRPLTGSLRALVKAAEAGPDAQSAAEAPSEHDDDDDNKPSGSQTCPRIERRGRGAGVTGAAPENGEGRPRRAG